MTCTTCGTPVTVAASSCPQCGSPLLQQADAGWGQPVPPAPGQPTAAVPHPPPPPPPGPPGAPGAHGPSPFGPPGHSPDQSGYSAPQGGYTQPPPHAYGYGTPHTSYGMFNTPPIPTPSGLGLFEAVKRVLSNYATFSGRASRSEYWWWTLAQLLAVFVPVVLLLVVGVSTNTAPGEGALAGLFSLWIIVVVLGTIVPTIAATARRLHDIGQSGWLYLIVFIPSIGSIALLVLCALPSQPVANQYGLAPVGAKPPFQL